MVKDFYIREERLKEEVRKYYPNIDPDRPFKEFFEIKTLIKGVNQKRKEESLQKRMAVIEAKQIEPGCQVVDEDKKIFTLKKIRKDGYVILVGQKGAFNAAYLWRI